MKFLIFILILLTSCGGGGDGGGSSSSSGASSGKAFWSTWTEDSSGYQYLMSGGDFDTTVTLYNAKVVISSSWVTALTNAGRSALPTIGGVYNCNYSMYVVGNNSSGNISFDTGSNADTVSNNACLMYDNQCLNGTTCAYSGDHLYTISTGDVMTIDWFGTADSGAYGSDTYR